MTANVVDEVEQLFVSQHVENVRAHAAKLKNEVSTVQHQLRELIGLNYQDLLQACDMIVGMDATCQELQQMHQSTQGTRRATVSPPAEHFENAEESNDAEYIEQVLREIHSIRCLLDSSHFFDASLTFKRAMNKLHIALEATTDPDAYTYVSTQLQGLSKIFSMAMYKRIRQLSQSPVDLSIQEYYADFHACVENMYTCDPVAAWTRVIQLHHDILNELQQVPVSSSVCQQIVSVMIQALFYCESCRVANPRPPLNPQPSLKSLLDLDVEGSDYVETVALYVCGLQALTPQYHSPLDGWAMSPPANTPFPFSSIPEKLIREIKDHTLLVLKEVLPKISSPYELVQVDLQLTDQIKSFVKCINEDELETIFDYKKWTHFQSEFIFNALLQLVEVALKELRQECIRCCDGSHTQSSEADQLVTLMSSKEALQKIVDVKLYHKGGSRVKLKLKRESSGGFDAVQQKAEHLLELFSVVLQHRLVRNELLKLTKIVSDGVNSVVLSLKDQVKAAEKKQNENLLPLLGQISDTLSRLVQDMDHECKNSAELQEADVNFTTLYRDLDELNLSCYQPRISATAKSLNEMMKRSFFDEFGWQEGVEHFSNTWSMQQVEGATVNYPCKATAAMSQSLLRLQNLICSQQRIGCMRQFILRSFYAEALRSFEKTLSQYVDEQLVKETPTEEALLQLYFDMLFAVRTLSFDSQVKSAEFHRVVHFIEDNVDVVNWSVAAPIIENAVDVAHRVSSLALGGSGAKSTSTAEEQLSTSIVMREEVERILLLPVNVPLHGLAPLPMSLPVQPSSTTRSNADSNATVVTSTKSLLADATKSIKGLKTVFGWGAE